ncbi:hypothetical protein C8Q76DRAFT_296085 [Earliella scabrosa]|nr:hypothetical protein C8Q76DRAFT_296085 [Earliella scabrosa]
MGALRRGRSEWEGLGNGDRGCGCRRGRRERGTEGEERARGTEGEERARGEGRGERGGGRGRGERGERGSQKGGGEAWRRAGGEGYGGSRGACEWWAIAAVCTVSGSVRHCTRLGRECKANLAQAYDGRKWRNGLTGQQMRTDCGGGRRTSVLLFPPTLATMSHGRPSRPLAAGSGGARTDFSLGFIPSENSLGGFRFPRVRAVIWRYLSRAAVFVRLSRSRDPGAHQGASALTFPRSVRDVLRGGRSLRADVRR